MRKIINCLTFKNNFGESIIILLATFALGAEVASAFPEVKTDFIFGSTVIILLYLFSKVMTQLIVILFHKFAG
ncbi:hemolysin III family channel protein [Fructobacillus ficulneus]|uniref:Hemolysin III family channel protein n=1 Tax=Fructobacillus ficulneus TaxID=157463 RepID=A0A0K8MG97_9LACO|nr:hemolysin III family channel protein [Fructobacillus ficulneus]